MGNGGRRKNDWAIANMALERTHLEMKEGATAVMACMEVGRQEAAEAPLVTEVEGEEAVLRVGPVAKERRRMTEGARYKVKEEVGGRTKHQTYPSEFHQMISSCEEDLSK